MVTLCPSLASPAHLPIKHKLAFPLPLGPFKIRGRSPGLTAGCTFMP